MFRILFVLISLAALALAPAMQAQVPERPNIVMLFADDLGYGDLSSYGHPTILTPRLDRMAREGLRLTSFYSGAPVCTPSRAALLTGRYPIRSGMHNNRGPNSTDGIPASEVLVAEALKERGYRTAAIGKWHLGHLPEYLPTNNGFDEYFGIPFSNDMMPPFVADAPGPVPLMRGTRVVERPVDQRFLTRRYTEEAVRFIRESGDQPFFVYLAYAMPHLPVFASPEFSGRSRAGLYGDVIEEMDWSVGRILDELEQLGKDRNTLVIFTSDNGPWLNLPDRMLQDGVERWHAGSPGLLRGAKGTTYEGGVRVPAVVRWPGVVPPERVSAELASVLDLYPTFLSLAGAPLPRDRKIDGRDLLPFFRGASQSPTDRYYYFRGGDLQGVRDGRWKLRESGAPGDVPGAPPHGGPELFDLERDPSERYNVADDHPDVVRRLEGLLRSFQAEVGAE